MSEEEVDLPEEQDELFEHHKFIVDAGQEPLRVDKYLMNRIPNTSRSKIQSAAQTGTVLINEKPVKANHKVKPGNTVSMVLPYPVKEFELVPEDIPLDIVYEDDTLLIVNKAAGMVVHPGHGNLTGTLVHALAFYFDNLPEKKDGYSSRPGLVHRLDKNTTGLMVIAKTEHALTHLSNQFYKRTTERTYRALVWGDFEEEEGTITGNIGRSLKNRKVMEVFEEGDFGKHAVTHFKMLKRYGYVSWIECKLETGRTHQIRAHFRFLRHPLFNDPEYGGDKILKGTSFTKYKQFIDNCFKVIPRHALHAKTLGFEHPETGEYMRFDSEIPQDMKDVLEKWDGYVASRKD